MRRTWRNLLPWLVFIGSAALILLVHFDWKIEVTPADGAIYLVFPRGIYLMPIVWMIVLCIPAAWIYFRQDKFQLPAVPPAFSPKRFVRYFVLIYGAVLVFRTFIIWQYDGPYEKLPIILFFFLFTLLVEQIPLKHYGLHGQTWKKDLHYVAYLCLIVLLLLLPLVLIAWISFAPQVAAILPQLVIPNGLVLISFPFQTIAVGISEEFMFRGYLYGNCRRSDPNRGKIHVYGWMVLASLIFGLFHVPWYVSYSPETFFTILPANIMPMIERVLSTGAFGLVMCLIFEHTQSLTITVVLHGLWNTLGAFLGSALIAVDLGILDTITWDQIAIFALAVIGPFIVCLVLFLKMPRFLARRLGYTKFLSSDVQTPRVSNL